MRFSNKFILLMILSFAWSCQDDEVSVDSDFVEDKLEDAGYSLIDYSKDNSAPILVENMSFKDNHGSEVYVCLITYASSFEAVSEGNIDFHRNYCRDFIYDRRSNGVIGSVRLTVHVKSKAQLSLAAYIFELFKFD